MTRADGGRGRLAAIVVVAAVAVALGVAGPAGAQTIGTPLGTGPFTGPPNNRYDCTQYDTRIGGVYPVVSPDGAGSASSCIWLDTPSSDPAAAFYPINSYGTFTVTQVRVSVGSVAGPMEAVVMRGLYQNTDTPGRPNYACCELVSASTPFTPQADAVTAVNVQLPLQEDPTPPPDDTTTVAVNDILALAVLEPGVPVPMYDLDDQLTADFLWNTANPSTQTPGFYSDTYGFHVAMDADYTAAAGASVAHAAGGATRPASSPASMAISTSAALSLTTACASSELCFGPWWVL